MNELTQLDLKSNIFDQLRKSNATSSHLQLRETFNFFDKDQDGFLNDSEFGDLLSQLFCHNEISYSLTTKQQFDFMKLFDDNHDGKIDLEEFKIIWYHWFKQVLDPVSALIVVDVQNDFIDGPLAIKDCPAEQDGESVVPIINHLIDTVPFDTVTYSGDWHPNNHISFIENVHMRKIHHSSKVNEETAKILDTVVFEGPPITEQIMWPAHCVQNTEGAKLHSNLKLRKGAIFINKGTDAEIDSYSAFWDNKKLSQTNLLKELTKRGVTDCYICGLATDVCVGSTALHSLEHGFRTTLIEDASKGVLTENIEKMCERLKRQGAIIVDSDKVSSMVDGKDRRPELGYQAALNVALAKKLVQKEMAENHQK